MKRLLHLFLSASLVACGSKDPSELTDEGMQALRSGKYQEAQEHLDRALADIGNDPSQPGWMRAKMGSIEVLIHLDPNRAKDEFLTLAAANPSKVTDEEFSLIGGLLGEARELDEAVAVLTAGMEAHQESPHLQALRDRLGKMAEASGDAGATDALKGLGYVGD